MTTPFESAIVRIRDTNSRIFGTGFLVTGRHVFTCAHVVTSAFNLPHDTPNLSQADLYLDFPLLAPGSTLAARVSHWQPAIDIAVLELTTDPPVGSKPVRLVTPDDLWGHTFRALGFPAGYEQGVWASGVIRGQQADGWLQIEDTKETGYLIAPGFSGGPVWDDVLGGVVGMIVAADTDERIKAAFLIPADVLVETLPDLAHAYDEWAQAQLDADMDQLRARRDQADEARREMRERQRVVNLRPLDVTHTFKDRVREVQALCDHLTDSSVRLVSVVGRSGMGKTALVSRVLGDLEEQTSKVLETLEVSGILYLSARSTGLGLERIYADVGRMLGEPAASRLVARWASGDTPLALKVEYLLEAMHDGLYLILLDNLEDNLTEDSNIAEEGLRLFVERCLTQPSGARLIVTSREQVKLAAAALRNARRVPLREGLPEDEAVALLRDLDPQGTLGLRDAPKEDLRRATQLTRGIPRALEILAGILYEDPTANLSRLLADEKLFGEQVVEQLVATGYSRLGETERQVIEALAVFDWPMEETAIAYLMHPWWPGLDVRARLHRLIRGYFVSVNRVTGRYSLHPLDRDYAYHQIPDVADAEPDSYNRRNLELRAADFYASTRKPESEWKSIDDLEPQLNEFEHRVRAGEYSDACRILDEIDDEYLHQWGYYLRLVKLRTRLQGQLTHPELQVNNLHRLGIVYRRLDRVEEAIEFYWQGLDLARKLGKRQQEGRLLGALGGAYSAMGYLEEAVEFLKDALDIAREEGDLAGECGHLINLGVLHRKMKQAGQSVKLYQEALSIARDIESLRREGVVLSNLGFAYRELGYIDYAIRYFKKALAIGREIGHRSGEGIRLANLGFSYYELGHLNQAVRFYKAALDIAREIRSRTAEAIRLGLLGRAHQAWGNHERAISFFREALMIDREMHYRRGESLRLLWLSQSQLAIGNPSEARERCVEALSLNVPSTDHKATLTLGIVFLHQHDSAVREIFEKAVDRCRARMDKTADLYRPHYILATALVGQAVCDPRWAEESKRAELLAPALEEYRRALEICAAPGVVQDALRDLELIRAAGIEGLEPVFELLVNAEYKPDLPEDLADIPGEVA